MMRRLYSRYQRPSRKAPDQVNPWGDSMQLLWICPAQPLGRHAAALLGENFHGEDMELDCSHCKSHCAWWNGRLILHPGAFHLFPTFHQMHMYIWSVLFKWSPRTQGGKKRKGLCFESAHFLLFERINSENFLGKSYVIDSDFDKLSWRISWRSLFVHLHLSEYICMHRFSPYRWKESWESTPFRAT